MVLGLANSNSYIVHIAIAPQGPVGGCRPVMRGGGWVALTRSRASPPTAPTAPRTVC
jgi:hypothetical protein